MDFKKIKNDCEKCLFDVNFDYGNEQSIVFKTSRGVSYEFVAHYTKTIKNHREASYLQPEEADVIFSVTDISELSIYDHKSRLVDLTNGQTETLYEIIKNKLVK